MDQPYLSAAAIAKALDTSPAALGAWLTLGRQLGVRFELVSPLLEIADSQLVGTGGPRLPGGGAFERLVLTPDGAEPLRVTDPVEHARIDRNWEAAALALAGDERALRRFDELTVAGVELASKVGQVRAWAERVIGCGGNR